LHDLPNVLTLTKVDILRSSIAIRRRPTVFSSFAKLPSASMSS
jgi:hypothetical protein